VRPNQARTVTVFGNPVTFLATSKETRGAYGLVGNVIPGQGPPPHTHRNEDEAFYVLEGELDILVGLKKMRVTAGTFIFVPRGVVHAFDNAGTAPAKLLLIFSPAGFEGFFEELGEVMPTFEEFDMGVFTTISEKYGQTVVELPPGL